MIPKNPEVKAAILEVLSQTKGEVTMQDLRKGVADHLKLTEKDLKETTESGNGNRFQIRFSAQLGELAKAGQVVKNGNSVKAKK